MIRRDVDPKPLAILSITVLASLGCFFGGGEEPDIDPEPRACPFTFPAADETFDEAGSPALLTFPVFDLESTGASDVTSSSFQYLVSSSHTFINSDGRPDNSPAISVIQNISGPAVVYTAAELPAEKQRTSTNLANLLDAQTVDETLTLSGVAMDAQISTAPASKQATIYVPLEDGAFFASFVIGVFPARAGCDATVNATFDQVIAGLALNADSTFETLESVIEAKAAKQ